LHPRVSGDDVADGERFRVPHVQVPRGVGEHVQLVEPAAAVVLLQRTEHAVPFPHGLPPGLDLGRFVPLHLGMVPRALRASGAEATLERPVRPLRTDRSRPPGGPCPARSWSARTARPAPAPGRTGPGRSPRGPPGPWRWRTHETAIPGPPRAGRSSRPGSA